MPTVLCPLPTNPPHEHELLTSKKSVPYVRCDVFQSHLYFRSDLAKGWLAEHAESGGTIENPWRTKNRASCVNAHSVENPDVCARRCSSSTRPAATPWLRDSPA